MQEYLKTVYQNMQNIKIVNRKVLRLYNNQPEFKISFKKYIDRNITSKRIENGKVLLQKHKHYS